MMRLLQKMVLVTSVGLGCFHLHSDVKDIQPIVPQFKVHQYLLSKTSSIFVALEDYTEGFNALCVFDQDKGGVSFRSMTPEHIVLNNVPNQPNPIFNNHIDILKLLEVRPALTVREKPDSLYVYDLISTDSNQHILAVDGIADASGAITAGIEEFSFALSGTSEPLNQFIIVAVKGADGSAFGLGNSGLALIKAESVTLENERTRKRLSLLDARSGKSGACAQEFSKKDIFSTTDKVTIIPDTPSLCWQPGIERLYVGMHVAIDSDAQEDECCSALGLVALNSEGALRADPIIRAASVDLPFIARGPGSQAHVHHLAPFNLKNRLSYLIMVGGRGQREETARQVYALPLTNHGYGTHRIKVMDDQAHGTIATCSKMPHERLQLFGDYKYLRTQALEEEIDQSNHLQLSPDALRVGGKDAPGVVARMITMENCVYVSTMADGTEPAGIFYSQALYKGDGTIFAWTPWRRFAGTNLPVSQFSIDPRFGFCRYISHDESGPIANVTSWRTHEHAPESFRYGKLMQSINTDFAAGGLNVAADVIIKDTPYLVVAGQSKITLYSAAQSEAVFSINHDGLKEIGGLTSLAYNEDVDGGVVALGGISGVAFMRISRDSIGSFALEDITIVPQARRIDKIEAAAGTFFILTYEGLYAIKAQNYKQETLHKIIDGRAIKAFLYDVIISDQGGLLATARDLYSFALTQEGKIDDLIPLGLPLQSKEIVKGLFTATPDGSPLNLYKGSQVYALVNNVSENYSQVYRLFVAKDATSNIYAEIATDYKKKNGQRWPLIIFPTLQEACITDGMQLFAITPAMQQTKPRLYAMHANVEDIIIMSKYTMHAVRLKLGKTSGIKKMFWSKTLNTWLVAGDFGVRLIQ